MFIPQQSNLINMLLQRKSYFRDNNRENVYNEITGYFETWFYVNATSE